MLTVLVPAFHLHLAQHYSRKNVRRGIGVAKRVPGNFLCLSDMAARYRLLAPAQCPETSGGGGSDRVGISDRIFFFRAE